MKIMRKILALVLVLASLASFALVAGAADFTDARNIKHGSAVDVLVGLGVVNGYENGSFKPTSSVTRAEMAKMLSFVMNGGADVGDMYAGACTFADSASHWAKGYIGYCVTMGLINGKNATTFAPDDKVTGYEAAKMMLCALGYKADLNGLTGPQWNTNTHSLGIKAKLFERLVDYTPKNALNRDDACQMILNTMMATMVETTGTVTDIEGVVITNDVKNTVLNNNMTADFAGRRDEDTVAAGAQNYLQLVENCFSDLKLASGNNDAFGRPCDVWTKKGTVISSEPSSNAIASGDQITNTGVSIREALGNSFPLTVSIYTNGSLASTGGAAELADILSDAKSTLPAATKASFAAARNDAGAVMNLINKVSETDLAKALATVAVNTAGGRAAGAMHALARIWKKSTSTVGYYYLSSGIVSSGAFSGTGIHTEVYFDEITQHLTICWAPYYYGKVTGVRPATTDANGDEIMPAYVTLSPISSPATFGSLILDDDTTIPGNGAAAPVLMDRISISDESPDVKVGSYIAYYAGMQKATGTAVVEGAIPMGTVTTTLIQTRQYNGSSYDYRIRAKDKTYYYYNGYGTQTLHDIALEYTIHFAMIGSRACFFFSEASSKGYAYIYDANEVTPAVVTTYKAKLVKADGSVAIVETDKNYRANVGSVATYTTNSAGKTVLNPVGAYSGNFNVSATINNSNSTVTFDGVQQVADTKTTFVIGTTDALGNEAFTVYKGIDKVPTTTKTQYYAYALGDAGTLDIVFMVNASGMTSATQEGVLFKTGLEAKNTGANGDYYTVQAIHNGEVTTMNLLPAAYAQLNATGFTLFNGYTNDATGYVSGISKVTGTALTTFVPAEAGNVTLNGVPYTYNPNVLVYTYSLQTQSLAISTVEALYQMNTTQYGSFYTLHELVPNKPLAAIFMVVD